MQLSSKMSSSFPTHIGVPANTSTATLQKSGKPLQKEDQGLGGIADKLMGNQQSSQVKEGGLRGQQTSALIEKIMVLDLFIAMFDQLGKKSKQEACSPLSPECASATPGASEEKKEMPFEEVVSVLGRNEKLLKKPLDEKGLKKLRDDPNTPSDAKEALTALLNNPAYYAEFDKAKNGKSDGKISSKDVQKLQEHPQIRAYADAKAVQYTDNYVPSNSEPGTPARAMTANDAMRELYQYSESLPKNVSMETLQKIADGSQSMGKCPPQVAAAAKFFVQNPDKWKEFSGKENPSASISRDRLCDLSAQNVKLNPDESKALETLKNNKDIFFKGGAIKQDKLEKIANDDKQSPEVRDAARLLAEPNSMLFTMLDNGKHGAGGNFFNKANDRKISKGDLDAFIKKGTNEVADTPPPSKVPNPGAQKDMDAGLETQPDAKKQKGGGIFKLLDALSYVASAALMLIPGVGTAAGLAMTAGRTAATAIARTVATTVGKEAVKQGTKEAVKQGTQQAVKQGTQQAVKQGTKDAATQTVKQAGKNGAQNVPKTTLKETGKDFTKDLLKDVSKDTLKDFGMQGLEQYRLQLEERLAQKIGREEEQI